MPRIESSPRSLTVFVPALNEENNLGPTIERLKRALADTVQDFEIVIVDDGSSDRTGQIADDLAKISAAVRAIHHAKCLGLGRGYITAVEASTKAYFVFVPGDNTWPLESLRQLFSNLGQTDVIVSFPTNSHIRPPGRRIISDTYTRALNLAYGLDLRYYNGLAIYPTEFLRSRPVTTFGFGFAAEVLLKAIDAGMSYKELGLEIEERAVGQSKALTLKNVLSVAASVLGCYWQLKIRGTGVIAARGATPGKSETRDP